MVKDNFSKTFHVTQMPGMSDIHTHVLFECIVLEFMGRSMADGNNTVLTDSRF